MRTLETIRTDFISFLRDYFSSDKLTAGDHGRILHWDEDPNKTKMLIRGGNLPNPQVLNTTPAIIVTRSDITENKEYETLGKSLVDYDWDTGEELHIDLMSGDIIFSCLSANDEQAELIAHIVYGILKMHRQYFYQTYQYRRVSLGGIGKPRIIQGEGEGTKVAVWNCGVVANVVYHFGYRYRKDGEIGTIQLPLRPPIQWIDDLNGE